MKDVLLFFSTAFLALKWPSRARSILDCRLLRYSIPFSLSPFFSASPFLNPSLYSPAGTPVCLGRGAIACTGSLNFLAVFFGQSKRKVR